MSTVILGFPTMTSSKKVTQMIETMTDNRKQQYGHLNRKYFIWARHGRKPQNCRWNFDGIHYSSRDISIAGWKFTRVWRYARQQLPVHRLTTWLLHFVPTSYSAKVTKQQRQRWTEIFYWFKNWAGAFLPPSAIRELKTSSFAIRILSILCCDLLLVLKYLVTVLVFWQALRWKKEMYSPLKMIHKAFSSMF